ncbi:hypothetical protein MIZ03_2230 [Rhodoferax lithotrophicus]|uniref:Glycoside hydrolase family 5 domain-containing protein n=2 Tax=Rhodoferax lithotrophicus TaxID=2798804 RepID=A0ABM7MM86_9BURK|nr:hypothetical protein MIZ03_2230 [Rhodoferax sp. MIZ03]
MVVLKVFIASILSVGVMSSVGADSYKANFPVDAKYFGQHMHQLLASSNPTPWPTVKFGTLRLWDAYVQWPLLEPTKGQWDFSKLDKYVEMAESHGVEILLPLGLSPSWASARPSEQSAYAVGNSAEPASMVDWRNYVRTVATRYKGRVHCYELWNEVNLPKFYSGSPEKLVELAQEMYSIIKEVDSTNTVVSPSITGDSTNAKQWLSRYLAAGGGKFADVIGYHFYVTAMPPEVLPSFVSEIKAIVAKYGYSKLPLWNTEAGWRIANTDGTSEKGAPSAWKRLEPDEAASYVARALVLTKASGVERFYWYAWDDGYMGSIEPKTKVIKPAGRAFGQVYEWLVGSFLKQCVQSEALWTCRIVYPDGKQGFIAWTTGNEKNWLPPEQWKVQKIQMLDGRWLAITPNGVTLTHTPVLYVQ